MLLSKEFLVQNIYTYLLRHRSNLQLSGLNHFVQFTLLHVLYNATISVVHQSAHSIASWSS